MDGGTWYLQSDDNKQSPVPLLHKKQTLSSTCNPSLCEQVLDIPNTMSA
jgi:hypothetical protein